MKLLRPLVGFLAVCSGLALCACQPEEDEIRAPSLVGGVGTSHTGNSSESMGGGPTIVAGERLTGTIASLPDDGFEGPLPYRQAADVVLVSSDGTTTEEVAFDGAAFSFEDVELSSGRWIWAKPVNDVTQLATLSQHDLGAGTVTVPLVQRSVVDALTLTFTNPIDVNELMAQIALRIVDDLGEPIVGVGVLVSAGGLVAYASGDVWLDNDDSTNAEGLVFIANVPARALPGQSVHIILSGSVSQELDVLVASGATTVHTVVVKGP